MKKATTSLWTYVAFYFYSPKKPINKPFRRPLLIRLHRLFRLAEHLPMYIGVARMAQRLQIKPIEHKRLNPSFGRLAFTWPDMMHLSCKRTAPIRIAHLTKRIAS